MRKFRRWLKPRASALAILAGVVLMDAAAFWGQLGLARADQNGDYAAHYALIQRVVSTVESGGNPLDAWSPEWSFGYPQLRTYPSLSHNLVAAAYFAAGKTVALQTVFDAFRFFSVVMLPVSFFAMATLLGFEPMVAAAAAALIPLVATNYLFGLEFGSYCMNGQGLFAQSIASHFMLFAIGFGWRAVSGRGTVALAGCLAGLSFLAHFIFGYVAIVSIVLMALVPDRGVRFAGRAARVAGIALIAFAVSAGQLLVLWQDRAIINHTALDPAWKWDSFGAPTVLRWLFTGQLMDYGRLPVVSLLAALGFAVAILRKIVLRRLAPRRVFVLAAAIFWTLLFFGRPFWGRALVLFGVSPDLQLHRLIAAVQVFLVLAAATGLVALWNALRRIHWAAAAAGVGMLLSPAIGERRSYLAQSSTRNAEMLAHFENVRPDLDRLAALARRRGGRIFVMNTATGELPLQMFLDTMQVPMVPHTRHSMSLTSDLLAGFHSEQEFQYRLFNIRTVAAERGAPGLYPFLKPLNPIGSVQIYDAPGQGYFRVVDVAAAIATDRASFRRINDLWLNAWARRDGYLWLDFGDAPAGVPRIAESALGNAPEPPPSPAGTVLGEQQNTDVYSAEFDAAREAYVLFSMTFHPNWRVELDGRPRPTMMLSPGFLGVRTPAGRHRIECRYQPGPEKLVLTVAGFFMAVACGTAFSLSSRAKRR
jgi:hypothetical protein